MLRFVVVLVLMVVCQGSEVPGLEDLKHAEKLINKLSTTGELGDLLCSCSCKKPADCYEILKLGGGQTSGFYDIYPPFTEIPIKVRCDMESDGGGWTVIQRRQDGSVDFDRGWEDYKFGFGYLGGEFWLGNENIHNITNQKEYELCVETTRYDKSVQVNYYNYFRVADESRSYRLLTGMYTGREQPCSSPIGIGSGAIPDEQITASSEFTATYGPSKGRLGGTTYWMAKRNDANQWIQVDFGVLKLVIGVRTQSRTDGDYWVTKYKVLYGNDGKNWKAVQNDDQDDDMIFDGNTARNTEVTNYFAADVPVKAQYIRIQIVAWRSHISLRMELLGCDGDFLAYQTNQPFSTKDSGNDNEAESSSCGAERGAWWYGACDESSLNGRYRGGAAIVNKGIRWIDFQGEQWSLKSTEMKIRPVSHHVCDVDE